MERTVDAARRDQLLLNDRIQQRIRFAKICRACAPCSGCSKNARINALQFPCVEERRPVNELAQRRQRKVIQHAHAGKLRLGQILRAPLNRSASCAAPPQAKPASAAAPHEPCAAPHIRAMLRHKLRLAIVAQQARRHRHRAARIQHMHHRLAVVRRNLHRRMRAARGRPANQQRQLETLPLHLARHMHHLIERRRNQPAQPDQSAFSAFARSRIFSHGDHHAHVDDLVVIAGQHHAHNVLADVVNIALHRRQHNLSLRLHHLSGRNHRKPSPPP
jgi:hypothetical protein